MRSHLLTCAVAAVLGGRVAIGAINVPSDGSDGALVITSNAVIDLSQAITGNWDGNNSAHAGQGIYDSNKWAVVFKYSSVTISSSATLTFKNHASRAPVVWLVSGDVSINGVVSLDGAAAGYNAPQLAEPGPGGFRGGTGYLAAGVSRSAGFGLGGGSINGGSYGAGGSYGSVGGAGSAVYGNPSLLPLIGGSGGAGWSQDARGGGAGAGAILIASSGSISIAGGIHANGGSSAGATGSGSGGAIRLVADTLTGNGVVQCLGGGGPSVNAGGLGRIAIARVTDISTIQPNPDPSVVPLQPGSVAVIWPPADGPTARIVSIGAIAAPADPRASFGTSGADVTLPRVSTTPVIVETINAEDASLVTVRVAPRANGDCTVTTATLTQTVSTSPLVLRWTANVPVNDGYSAIQVKVVRP